MMFVAEDEEDDVRGAVDQVLIAQIEKVDEYSSGVMKGSSGQLKPFVKIQRDPMGVNLKYNSQCSEGKFAFILQVIA